MTAGTGAGAVDTTDAVVWARALNVTSAVSLLASLAGMRRRLEDLREQVEGFASSVPDVEVWTDLVLSVSAVLRRLDDAVAVLDSATATASDLESVGPGGAR